MIVSRAVLLGPTLLDVVQGDVEVDRAGVLRQERALLQLKVQNRHIRLSIRANSKPRCRVSERDIERRFCSTNVQTCNAQTGNANLILLHETCPDKNIDSPAREQLISDSQETRALALDLGRETTRRVNFRVSVEKIFTWDTNVLEPQFSIINA